MGQCLHQHRSALHQHRQQDPTSGDGKGLGAERAMELLGLVPVHRHAQAGGMLLLCP